MEKMVDFDDELSRARVAREEFIANYCRHMPPIYRAQIPLSYNGKLLMQAKDAIEWVMADDLAAMESQNDSPWMSFGQDEPKCRMVDWTGVDYVTFAKLGIGRGLGWPGTPKHDQRQHPEVVAAAAMAPRTAEFVAYLNMRRASQELQRATTPYVEAANSRADAATIKSLHAAEQAAVKASEAATKAYNKLRANPSRGLAIVRELPEGYDMAAELADAEKVK